MKNKLYIILVLSIVAVVSFSFITGNSAYAKPCYLDAKGAIVHCCDKECCKKCEQKCICDKNCCKDCKDCTNCCKDCKKECECCNK